MSEYYRKERGWFILVRWIMVLLSVYLDPRLETYGLQGCILHSGQGQLDVGGGSWEVDDIGTS